MVIPSERLPFSATDFYQIIDTSDVPPGTINIITGNKTELSDVLSKHDDVDGMWYFGTKEGGQMVESNASENLKRTWVNYGKYIDWMNLTPAIIKSQLRKASEIKNIWIPYGV